MRGNVGAVAGSRCGAPRPGGPRRRERIAVPEPAVLSVSALQLVRRPPVAARPRVAARETVVGRIGVEEDSRGPALLRGVNLHRAMTLPIARDDDLSAHVDAARRELRVVGRQPVVHIDDRRGDIARRRVGDEPGPSSGLLVSGSSGDAGSVTRSCSATGATRSTAMDWGTRGTRGTRTRRRRGRRRSEPSSGSR